MVIVVVAKENGSVALFAEYFTQQSYIRSRRCKGWGRPTLVLAYYFLIAPAAPDRLGSAPADAVFPSTRTTAP